MSKIRELNKSVETGLMPTLVILDTFVDLDADIRSPQRPPAEYSTPSPTSVVGDIEFHTLTESSEPEDLYSLSLLQHIASEISNASLSKLIVPIAMTHNWEGVLAEQPRTVSGRASRSGSKSNNFSQYRGPIDPKQREAPESCKPVDPKQLMRCLEAGAIDALSSPLHKDRIYALTAHAYRAHKDASKDQAAFLATKPPRKRSWVGVGEEQPYGYLRETMYVYI